MIVKALQQEQDSLQAEVSMQINNAVSNSIPSQVDSFLRNYMSNNILHVHPTQAPTSFTRDLQYQLYLMMKDDEQLRNDDLSIWWSLKIKFEKLATSNAPCRLDVVRTKDHEEHHDDHARPEGRAVRRDKRSSGTQEQLDEFDAWMDDFGTDDDEVTTEEVSPKLMEEISGEIDESQLQKAVNEMLRQRCNSGVGHKYHVDQKQDYLKSDIIWVSRNERLSLQVP
nr:hypothetical protein [Tanacetum cinerariifolium]